MKTFYFLPRSFGPWQDSTGNRVSLYERSNKTRTNAPTVQAASEPAAAVLFGLSAVDIVAPVPDEVPLWAFRTVAAQAGLSDAITAGLAGLPEPSRTAASELWERGNFVLRDSPTVVALTPALGLTTEQVDEFFRQAGAMKI